MVLQIAGSILLILTILSILPWISLVDDFNNCINESDEYDQCLGNFIVKSPPVQDVIEISENCQTIEKNCVLTIGKKVALDKLGKNLEKAKNQEEK